MLRLTHLFDDSEADAFAGPALDIFTGWSATEPDTLVLTEVLNALGEHADARSDAALLPYATHPDDGIRQMVASGLGPGAESLVVSDRVREALVALMADGSSAVRLAACFRAHQIKDRAPVFADAMFALVGDADRRIQVAAVEGLAIHDDERCVEAARRLGPPLRQPGLPCAEHYPDLVWLYEQRRCGGRPPA